MKKLTLSECAQFAEVVAAAAVVVSLIYVGLQVSGSTRAVRSASANATSAALSSWYAELGMNQQASRLYFTGMTNPESLSAEDLFQFVVQLHGLLLEYQAIYYLSQEGTLDTELQESVTKTLLGIKDLPGFRLYWSQRRSVFQNSFRRHIDDLITTGPTNRDMEQIYKPDVTE